jgi:uncharacterized membrane protein
MTTRRPTARTGFLIALLGGSGVLHFVRPAPFVAIVPKALPAAELLVAVSGAVELLAAGLLAGPRTRPAGGLLGAALLIGVFPANVSMALRADDGAPLYRAMTWARLPLQIPLVKWAWEAAR